MSRLPNTPYRYASKIDHGPRSHTLGVVIHDIEGSASGAEQYFRGGGSSGVGAQVIIGATSVVQLVPLENKCWHAMAANSGWIGFEHEGYSSDSRAKWTRRRKQRILSANRTAYVCWKFKLGEPKWGHNVRSHASGGAAWGNHGDPGPGFPVDLYMAACVRAYKNLVRSNGKSWNRILKGRN